MDKRSGGSNYCFESKTWKLLFDGREDSMFVLDKVFRQKDDVTFLNILNELREGKVSGQTIRTLTGTAQNNIAHGDSTFLQSIKMLISNSHYH